MGRGNGVLSDTRHGADSLGYESQPSANALPERLVTARRALGLSQRKMAEKLGVDPATIQDWEAGRHRPIKRSLDLIGRVLQSW